MGFNAEWVVGVIAAWVVIELIKFFANRKMADDTPLKNKELLKELVYMHRRTDENGRPLWYVPRELTYDLQETVKKIDIMSAEIMQIRHNQERIIDNVIKRKSD